MCGLVCCFSFVLVVVAPGPLTVCVAGNPQEKARFNERVNTAFGLARKVAIASSTFDGSIHLATNIALVSVLGYGGNLVLQGALTAGELTSFLMYSLYAGINLGSVSTAPVLVLWTGPTRLSRLPLSHPSLRWVMSQLANSFSKLMLAVGASNRVFQIMDREPRIPITGGDTLEAFSGNVRFSQVGFSYPHRRQDTVLSDFSLQLEPGKVRLGWCDDTPISHHKFCHVVVTFWPCLPCRRWPWWAQVEAGKALSQRC